MCLYPKLIQNPKYKPNKKNGGNIPPVLDDRVKYVPIGCQNCMECRKQKAREWQTRLLEDVKTHKNGKFITLTFRNDSIKEFSEMKANKRWAGLENIEGYERDNSIAVHAVRLFLERWRKKFKKSCRHWLVTELGHNGTENIHLHGILWTDESYETISKIWSYGYIWPRPEIKTHTWVNEQTVNYIVKYITKVDINHKHYKSQILTSAGIGHEYTETYNSKLNKYQGKDTKETYTTRSGHEIAMPIYWRNKIYSDSEREKLWLNLLDKNERWVMGERVDISKDENSYYKLLEFYRRRNVKLGYGTDEKDWNREQYEIQRRNMLYSKRTQSKT